MVLLVGVAAYRTVLAGCPNFDGKIDIACLFIPTHMDIGVHLLSYVFMGIILLFTSVGLVLWHQQRIKTARLIRNLQVLNSQNSKLEPLLLQFGLKDKVNLLDFEDALCFCAGFISPHIYLSRAVVDRLTTEELEALLLHEKHHLENCDPLKALLGRLIASALFFIPFLQDILTYYLIKKEIAADQEVIRKQGHHRGIAGALDKLLQDNLILPKIVWAGGGAGALEYRIASLLDSAPRELHPLSLRHTIISIIVIIILLTTIIAPLPGSHPIN